MMTHLDVMCNHLNMASLPLIPVESFPQQIACCHSFLWAKRPTANDIYYRAHPPYSPDLVSSDYRLSGPMKKCWVGRNSRLMCEGAISCLSVTQQPASFFASGIQILVDR